MPIYEYVCESCEGHFDRLFTSINRVPAEVSCPICQSSDTRRLVSVPAIHTEGKGGKKTEGEEAPSPKPPVFGRKELNELMKNKK